MIDNILELEKVPLGASVFDAHYVPEYLSGITKQIRIPPNLARFLLGYSGVNQPINRIAYTIVTSGQDGIILLCCLYDEFAYMYSVMP